MLTKQVDGAELRPLRPLVLPPGVAVAQFEFTTDANPHGGTFRKIDTTVAHFVALPPESSDIGPWIYGTVWLPGEMVYQILSEEGRPTGTYVCLHQGRLIE